MYELSATHELRVSPSPTRHERCHWCRLRWLLLPQRTECRSSVSPTHVVPARRHVSRSCTHREKTRPHASRGNVLLPTFPGYLSLPFPGRARVTSLRGLLSATPTYVPALVHANSATMPPGGALSKASASTK